MLVYKPKDDFQKTINFQGNYIELLKKLHSSLTEKCKKSKGYERANNDVMLYELAVKLDAQISLFTEKLSHYQDIFIKPYDLELEECAEQFDEVWRAALSYVDVNLEKNTEVCNKIKHKTEGFTALEWEDKNHIEVKNVVYKDLKNLLKLFK